MEVKPLSTLSLDYIEQLLAVIPLFKLVSQQDTEQFQLLLQASRLLLFSPHEVVVRRGDIDDWLYFLVKGRLAVYVEDPKKGELVNFVTPGEVFGDLSPLVGLPRTATVIAEFNFPESMVLAMDSRVFTDSAAQSGINIKTKLIYYRSVVHNLRWKLEVYRSQHLQHLLANKHRQVRLYSGVKDTQEELDALYLQAQTLARLLLEWNSEFGSLPPDAVVEPE